MTELGVAQRTGKQSSEIRTFLFADVRGYTRFTQEHGDEAGAQLAGRFAEIAREVVSAGAGEVIELRGDEALAVFASARQALRAATELQKQFAEEANKTRLPFKVGIGIDAGEAIPVEGGYRGGALNLGARLCSLAGPGEVLASEGVVHLARKMDGIDYAERGLVQLKGFDDLVRVVQIRTEKQRDEPSNGSKQVAVDQALPIGGFLGALPSGILIARDEELSRVLTAVDAVAAGSGRLVLLAGEPGVGKTRLAQEVTLAVRNRDFLVASGRCYEPYESVPFYPFIEALTAAYQATTTTVREEAQKRFQYLGRLLPDHVSAPPLGEGQDEQQRLFRAVTGFLTACAAITPVALLLDDLHWADTASLELLQHLARQTRAHPILLLATYRDVEVQRGHPLGKALRDLHREQLTERISVRRLEEAGTMVLVAQTFGEGEVSSEFAHLVYRHTEGNPFFTQEVLRALVERGDIYREEGRWERKEIAEIEVPESIREAVGERLSRLSNPAQELLREASVLGQVFTFDDLRMIGNHTEDDMERALEEATEAGLVREIGGDDYGFSHALVQQTLDAELSARRKRRLHLAAGEALEQLPEEVRERRAAELAWHFLQADDPERALIYSMLAAEQAQAVAAHEEAEKHYRTSAELARELADRLREAQATEGLGRTLGFLARHDEAMAPLNRAADLYREEGEIDSYLRVGSRIGRMHFSRATLREGVDQLQHMVAGIEEKEYPALISALYIELSRLLALSGQLEEAFDLLNRSVELARAAGGAKELAASLDALSTGLYFRGRPQEAKAALWEALELAEQVQDPSTLYSVSTGLAEGLEAEGDLEECLKYRRRALESAEREGDVSDTFFALLNVAQTLMFKGDWRAARLEVEKSREIQAELPPSFFTAYPSMTLGWLDFFEGDLSRARRLLTDSLDKAIGSDPQLESVVHRYLADMDLLDGRSSEALSHVESIMNLRGPPLFRFECLPTAAEVYLAVDDLDRADTAIAQGISGSVAQGQLRTLIEARRVEGILRSRQGRWMDAEAAFADSVEKAVEMSYPYAEGRALYDWALMELRRDDDAPFALKSAREHLERGLALFIRLGARLHAERAQALLSELDQP